MLQLGLSSSKRTTKLSVGKRKEIAAAVGLVGSEDTIDIRGVAARVGVSIATASRAINHVPTVDPALAERVWQVVDELNSSPNTQARALVAGRGRLLGRIVIRDDHPLLP